MTLEMYERLHELCGELDVDPRVRVVVLRGAGDKAFVSGTVIRQFLTFSPRDDALEYEGRIARVLGRLHAMTRPAIAMVQGDAAGGGRFMARACDRRVATPSWKSENPTGTGDRRAFAGTLLQGAARGSP